MRRLVEVREKYNNFKSNHIYEYTIAYAAGSIVLLGYYVVAQMCGI